MKKAVVFFTMLILIFSLCSCKDKDKAPALKTQTKLSQMQAPAKDNGAVRAYMLKADTLNPLLTKIDTNRTALSLIYDPLFYNDASYKTQMRLAESYTFSEDCTSLTIKLRDDVTWHDGSSLTADDVIYTIENILDSSNESYYYTVTHALISEVKKVDSHTLFLTFNYPNGGAVSLLDFPILKYSESNMKETAEKYMPLGTGCFKIKEYGADTAMLLEKNADWKCGSTSVKLINMSILPDRDSVYSAFNSGLIDFIRVNWENVGKYTISETTAQTPLYTGKYTFLGLNTEHDVLQYPQVRRLISYLCEREIIADTLLNGYAEPSDIPVHPNSQHYTGPGEAVSEEAMLQASGCVKAENGLLYFHDTEEDTYIPLEFSLIVNQDNAKRCLVAERIASAMANHGITITVVKTDFDTYYTDIDQGNFDLYMGETVLSPDMNFNPLFGESGRSNHGKFYDPVTSGLTEEILKSCDPGQRSGKISDFLGEFRTKSPHIPLYFESEMIAYNSKKLSGVTSVLSENYFEFLITCSVNTAE